MSKEENRKMISAYEQMLKDGTAFKEVDLTMHTQPDVSEATGARGEPINTQISDNPMGQPLNDDGDDAPYSEFDSVIPTLLCSTKFLKSMVEKTSSILPMDSIRISFWDAASSLFEKWFLRSSR